MTSVVGALWDVISGRKERREQRRARRRARRVVPGPIAPRVSVPYYAIVTKYKKDGTRSSSVFQLNSASFATAQRHFKDLRGWDEVRAIRGELAYPHVVVYEFWDKSSGRPVRIDRWDTTQIDPELRRQWIAMMGG